MLKMATKKTGARSFSHSFRNDYVQVNHKAKQGDVFQSIETELSKTKPLKPVKTENYIQKYRTQLENAAKSKGFSSVQEMIDNQQEQKVAEEKLRVKKELESNTQRSESHASHRVYSKSLGDIIDMEKMKSLPKVTIEKIWNLHHSTKDTVSAALDPELFKKMKIRSKECSMFVLPLPRDVGIEFYFLQFQGNQVYFTPLLEYQHRGEAATPSFSITFYTELAESNDIILMLGQISENSPLSLNDCQNLIYQLQLYYMVGTEQYWDLVQMFHKDPANFDYKELISLVSTPNP